MAQRAKQIYNHIAASNSKGSMTSTGQFLSYLVQVRWWADRAADEDRFGVTGRPVLSRSALHTLR